MNTHGRGRFVVAVAAVAAISAAGGTDALASASCTAANSGALNADLPAGGSLTRELALDAGDTLGIPPAAPQPRSSRAQALHSP
jgi:hypothetical protein